MSDVIYGGPHPRCDAVVDSPGRQFLPSRVGGNVRRLQERTQANGMSPRTAVFFLGAMLAGWLGYFLVVHTFVNALNHVRLPLLDLPLGVLMAMEGTVMIFTTVLFVLARHHRELICAR